MNGFYNKHFLKLLDFTPAEINSLLELSASHIPVLYVYNKVDRTDYTGSPTPAENKLFISARSEEGIDLLLDAIEAALSADDKEVSLLIPYSLGQIVSDLAGNAVILDTEYTPEGTLLRVCGSAAVLDR